jgi:hypothetical protein
VDERTSLRRVTVSRHVRNCRADGPLALAWQASLAYFPAGPAGLPARGLASLTVRVRPARSVPWRPARAVVVLGLSGIATQPKPLERPRSRSGMPRRSSTTPYGSKSWCRSSAAVVNARGPTEIFTKGSLWKMGQQSPDHPNSMQEQSMQEHHVGGKRRTEPRGHKVRLIIT